MTTQNLQKMSVIQPDRRRRTAAALVLTVTVVLTAACTAPESGPEERSSTSASAEFVAATEERPAQNVAAPDQPTSEDEPTEAGVVTALHRWWEAYNYLELTGDAEPLDALSSSGCASCAGTGDYWSGIYEDGSWSTGSERRAVDVTAELSPQKTDAELKFTVDEVPYDVFTSDGRVHNQDDRELKKDLDWVAKARHTDQGTWQIYDLWVLSPKSSESDS